MSTEHLQEGVTIVERYIDSAGTTAKIPVRHGRYGYADENGGSSGIVIDETNSELVVESGLVYEAPLQPGDKSSRTLLLEHQQRLLEILNN